MHVAITEAFRAFHCSLILREGGKKGRRNKKYGKGKKKKRENK